MQSKYIRRGSIPTHHISVPYTDSISSAKVIYRQRGGRPITKAAIIDLDNECLTVTLAREETLKFVAGKDVRIQIIAYMTDGSIRLSNIVNVECAESLGDSVTD